LNEEGRLLNDLGQKNLRLFLFIQKTINRYIMNVTI